MMMESYEYYKMMAIDNITHEEERDIKKGT